MNERVFGILSLIAVATCMSGCRGAEYTTEICSPGLRADIKRLEGRYEATVIGKETQVEVRKLSTGLYEVSWLKEGAEREVDTFTTCKIGKKAFLEFRETGSGEGGEILHGISELDVGRREVLVKRLYWFEEMLKQLSIPYQVRTSFLLSTIVVDNSKTAPEELLRALVDDPFQFVLHRKGR